MAEIKPLSSSSSFGRVASGVVALFRAIVVSAWEGQHLPQLTLGCLCHGVVHASLFGVITRRSRNKNLQPVSGGILCVSCLTCVAGYTLLLKLYRHSVMTIFNRKLPPTILECLPSFLVHMSLLKPLEIMWRRMTVRWRVLPDVLILGEVRCGTTTLAQHLSSIDGCHKPFCLWKHPELDHKETFYFVGHYLGNVDPSCYRMCFPLKRWRWFRRRRRFFTFDGCAQYLTHPTVPYLIAKAYRDANQPLPVLVACVRNPVDQAISWWRFENNAMSWGEKMGLHEWNTELRSSAYPPRTISEALDFSLDKVVEEWYQRSESLFQSDENHSFIMKDCLITWPGGQLSGIGRNGRYIENIQRYERVFAENFSSHETGKRVGVPDPSSKLRFVNVVPLEFLQDGDRLNMTIESIMQQVDRRNRACGFSKLLCEQGRPKGSCVDRSSIHRNASTNLLESSMEPTEAEKSMLLELFSASIRELETICGFSFGWSAKRREKDRSTTAS